MMDKEKASILIVEDEDSIRLTLRDYLKKKGYKLYVASDGVGALKIILDHDIDIIVTDYRMSVLGGDYWIKFLEQFCSDKKGSHYQRVFKAGILHSLSCHLQAFRLF